MQRNSLLIAGILFALVVCFRIFSAQGILPNFSPLPALLLCSLVFFRGKMAWLLPAIAWLVTDPIVSAFQGYSVLGLHHFGILIGLAACLPLVPILRKHSAMPTLLLGSVAAAALFYFFSNSVSFLVDPLYPKSLLGFTQAQWTGPVGLGPTWVFLRNLAAANFLFTCLAVLSLRPLTTKKNFPIMDKESLA